MAMHHLGRDVHERGVQYPYDVGHDLRRRVSQGQLQQNRDVQAAMTALVAKKAICSASADVFVWMEDDVSLCPGAAVHIVKLAEWMRSAPKPPVYMRLSMGFIGIMFHCTHLNKILGHFESMALLDNPGIDWTTAEAFRSQTMTLV